MRKSSRTHTPTERYIPEEWAYRKSIPAVKAAKIRNYQGNKCNCGCGTYINQENSQIDHIQEIADGGGNERSNLQALHTSCHYKKTLKNKKLRANRNNMEKKQLTKDENADIFMKASHCDLNGDLTDVVLMKKFIGYGDFYGIISGYSPCGNRDKFIINWTSCISGEESGETAITRAEIRTCRVF